MENKYQPVIGMEVHIELKTTSKMFCGCKNDPFGAPKPNIYTCPVCLGLPGALPVPNKKAIEWTIQLGLALGCKINTFSKFDRKHYFYPDLPKGYQISQYDLPFCYDGAVETSSGKIRIRRIHLEEDTGKLIHSTVNAKKATLIDFNRSGVPLIEIVTEPDITSSSQAKEYAKKLYQIIRYLDISDADMEKGQMRLEANISLKLQAPNKKHQASSTKLQATNHKFQAPNYKYQILKLPNYKVELKNINSFRFLEKAIEAEIERQKQILEKGETPIQETRGYNASKNITYSQRKKEDAEDYRYFPEPDIPPIKIDEPWLGKIKLEMPEPLSDLLSRWEKEYQAPKNIASFLFETKNQAVWIEGLLKQAKDKKINIEKLINFLVNKKIKVNLFVDDYQKIISAFNQATSVTQVDEKELEEAVKKAINDNSQAVIDFKAGKKNALNFLLGQTMKNLGKKADSSQIIKMILKQIEN